MRRTCDKRYIILHDHVQKNLELAYICEKVTLSKANYLEIVLFENGPQSVYECG